MSFKRGQQFVANAGVEFIHTARQSRAPNQNISIQPNHTTRMQQSYKVVKVCVYKGFSIAVKTQLFHTVLSNVSVKTNYFFSLRNRRKQRVHFLFVFLTISSPWKWNTRYSVLHLRSALPLHITSLPSTTQLMNYKPRDCNRDRSEFRYVQNR
jgi:hypothetical protein